MMDLGHKFITLKNKHDWGGSILYMEEHGKAFSRTYWYDDDKETIYFDWLNVDERYRGNGIATELLDIHINLAKEMRAESCLRVKVGTWVHDWYKRKGYTDLDEPVNESNEVWMGKKCYL